MRAATTAFGMTLTESMIVAGEDFALSDLSTATYIKYNDPGIFSEQPINSNSRTMACRLRGSLFHEYLQMWLF